MLVSSTERPPISLMGRLSTRPERYGADILLSSKLGSVGIQRKEVKDFIASITDGRLAKESQQLKHLAIAIIIIEGEFRWTTEGNLFDSYTRYTRSQHESMLLSLQHSGIWLMNSTSSTDTVRLILGIEKWANKTAHQSLTLRPKPAGKWGVTSSRDFSLHLLQSFDGIGAVTAAAILDQFQGVPLAWTATAQQLTQVPGVGPKRAAALMAALNPDA